MKKPYGIACFVAAVICSVSCSRAPDKKPPATSRFQTGQVWTFHTATNELTNAALKVVRIDFAPKLGPIISVLVTGGRYNERWRVQHMFYPFSEDALSQSVVTLVETNSPLSSEELKDFHDAYEIYRSHVEKGDAGKCFKITVAEVLQKQDQPPEVKAWWKIW